jgi:hypothetical protein
MFEEKAFDINHFGPGSESLLNLTYQLQLSLRSYSLHPQIVIFFTFFKSNFDHLSY